MVQLWRSFSWLVPVVAVLGAVVLVVVAVVSWGMNGSVRSRAAVGRALLDGLVGVWVLAVVGVTLLPGSAVVVPGDQPAVDLVPFRDLVSLVGSSTHGEVPVVQIGGNLALFGSGGVLLGLRSRWGWGRSVVGFAALGVLVETLQLVLGGRVAVLDDVLLTIVGGALGCAVGRSLRRDQPRVARAGRPGEPVHEPEPAA